ncbi:metallophosphoesterase [Paenibacillus wynnii]|uniref:Metallophosphoesterase n=2 Tax=Paenibacillus wynnii TaxID=268407 RepID=A0A098MCP6_9BACL|nr:lasso peptide biosynthesis PqqD family chaperone [Paenibacillus wynnii]KGE19322.1 metallophosphoesterase [Paenibacillus wynnii]
MMRKITTLHPSDIVVQAEGNIVSDMDGEKVMLSVQKGKYYNLGEVGGDIWNALSKPATVAEITSTIERAYEVKADICQQDVISFLQHLLDEELITLLDA